jgi:hypothetical protein
MATDVTVEVEIGRSPERVAAVMFDPGRDADWTTGVVAARVIEGAGGTETIVERDVRFAGRRFSYRYEVVEAGDRSRELRVTQPFPMAVTYRLEDAANGTRASIHARGDAGRFFGLGGPLLNAMVRRNIRRDLAALQRLVESGAEG